MSLRHMVLNAAINPWCQYSILPKTALMSFVTESLPLVVSVIEMVSGVIEFVKSGLVVISETSLKSRVDDEIEQCTQMNTCGRACGS